MKTTLSRFPLMWSLVAISIVVVQAGCTTRPNAKQVYPMPPLTLAPSEVPTQYLVLSLGQKPHSTFIKTVIANQMSQTVQVRYLLYLPDSYGKDPQQKWPLILFLHGRGERGDNLDLLKKQPLPKILEQQADFPFIVVSPQLSADKLWWSDMIDSLNTLLFQIQSTYSVDPKRVYLTGISMGGFGTWEFALCYPNRFAAIVPIAGGYQEGSRAIPENICALSDIPIWVFHGGEDIDVLPFQSEVLVDALKNCDGNIRFTFYADSDHAGSWTRAYADTELYQWLLAQTLK
jgi:predicted peptidase